MCQAFEAESRWYGEMERRAPICPQCGVHKATFYEVCSKCIDANRKAGFYPTARMQPNADTVDRHGRPFPWGAEPDPNVGSPVGCRIFEAAVPDWCGTGRFAATLGSLGFVEDLAKS